jgi:hypothetical protein
MGWRKQTFLDIQSLIITAFPQYNVDVFNNQFEDYEGAENNETVIAFPCLFIEFIGGDWQHNGLERICPAYFFRLHIGIEDYRESNTGDADQSAALDHLDQIEAIANILDLVNLTNVRELTFIREELDSSRSHIIEHILDFSGYVLDCSLEEERASDTAEILRIEQVVTNNDTRIRNMQNNNGYNIP